MRSLEKTDNSVATPALWGLALTTTFITHDRPHPETDP